MKFMLTTLLITFGVSVQAKTIDCYASGARWSHMRIINAGSQTSTFKVIDTNEAGKISKELGGVANLKLDKVVHPHGETFFHYKGTFAPGFRQKTISLYVKEDLTVLRFIDKGEASDTLCY